MKKTINILLALSIVAVLTVLSLNTSEAGGECMGVLTIQVTGFGNTIAGVIAENNSTGESFQLYNFGTSTYSRLVTCGKYFVYGCSQTAQTVGHVQVEVKDPSDGSVTAELALTGGQCYSW